MTRAIIIRPEAQREVQAAFDWYQECGTGLGFELLRAADACLSKLKRNHFAYPLLRQSTRRALLRKFPYSILYVVHNDRIVIIAFFHARRNPIDWLRRVEP